MISLLLSLSFIFSPHLASAQAPQKEAVLSSIYNPESPAHYGLSLMGHILMVILSSDEFDNSTKNTAFAGFAAGVNAFAALNNHLIRPIGSNWMPDGAILNPKLKVINQGRYFEVASILWFKRISFQSALKAKQLPESKDLRNLYITWIKAFAKLNQQQTVLALNELARFGIPEQKLVFEKSEEQGYAELDPETEDEANAVVLATRQSVTQQIINKQMVITFVDPHAYIQFTGGGSLGAKASQGTNGPLNADAYSHKFYILGIQPYADGQKYRIQINRLAPDVKGGVYQSGLRDNDELVAIDSIPITNRTDANRFEELLLSKDEQITRTITVRRDGKLFQAEVHSFLIDQGAEESALSEQTLGSTAYFKLKDFMTPSACQTLYDRISALESDPSTTPTGYILDLRGNRGGFIETASCFAGIFVDSDKKLGQMISTRVHPGEKSDIEIHKYEYGFFGAKQPLHFQGQWLGIPKITFEFNKEQNKTSVIHGPLTSKPLAVLVDQSSISATELFANAMQDLHRAVVIGEPTYGKGLYQASFITAQLSDGTYAYINRTIGQFLSPYGRIEEMVGVHPDIVAPNTYPSYQHGPYPYEKYSVPYADQPLRVSEDKAALADHSWRDQVVSCAKKDFHYRAWATEHAADSAYAPDIQLELAKRAIACTK